MQLQSFYISPNVSFTKKSAINVYNNFIYHLLILKFLLFNIFTNGLLSCDQCTKVVIVADNVLSLISR